MGPRGQAKRLVVTVAVSVLALACAGESTGRIGGAFEGSTQSDSLEIELFMSTCDADHEIESVVETEIQVIVTIRSTKGVDDDCGESVFVRLAEPLGDRTLIDGHDDQPILIAD